MATREAIESAVRAAVDSAALDPSALAAPRDERVEFGPEPLAEATRLLTTAADRERALEAADRIMRDAIWARDERRALAALKLLEKLEASGRRVYRETDGGLEPLP